MSVQNYKNKNAFTLAEIMIVLTVIGVLTAILLPVAYNAAPDEDVMKFKKANSTLASAIRELVNSDKYYLDGDLAVKYDGTLITPMDNSTYFCECLSDILSVKSTNCVETTSAGNYINLYNESIASTLDDAKAYVDKQCKNENFISKMGEQIVTTDGTIWYQTGTITDWGSTDDVGNRLYGPSSSGIDTYYEIFCIDIDDLNEGEDPFGYGIRADGKILTGARADEWMEKSIQRGNND